MRWTWLLLLSMIIVSTLPTIIGGGMIEDHPFENPIWEPRKPVAGDNITISFHIIWNGTISQDGIALRTGETDLNTTLVRVVGIGNGTFILYYESLFIPAVSGIFSIEVGSSMGGEWSSWSSFEIEVDKDQDSDNDNGDTILGMPRWYCSVTSILLTLLIIFFTWSYFKGRRMQKKNAVPTGNFSVECSECGKLVGTEESFCPWCGVSLDEEEYICGKCKRSISATDIECPHCGTTLVTEKKGISPSSSSSKRRELERKKKVEKKGKRECNICGTILMDNEKICPICKK